MLKYLKLLILVISHPKITTRILFNNLSHYIKSRHTYRPVSSYSIAIFEIDNNIIEPVLFHGGNSTVADYILLKNICATFPECKYLEIGTFRGESIANVLALDNVVLAKFITLPLSDKRIANLPNDIKSYYNIFLDFNDERLEGIYTDSQYFDFGNHKSKYDVIFIDGGHDYNSIYKDTINAFKLLECDDSVIVWHDFKSLSGSIRQETLRAVMDACPVQLHERLIHFKETLSLVMVNQNIFDLISKNSNLDISHFKLDIQNYYNEN
jgi:hypothetical protein